MGADDLAEARVDDAKGYRFRDIPVSKDIAEALLSFVGLRDGLALDDKSVCKQMQVVAKAVGLEKIRMHDLRRAWASAMHKNGASLKEVSVRLGHASVSTTERYTRIDAGAFEGHEYLPR